LVAYKYGQGFARFCTEKYTNEPDELDNNFIHLTNVSIQKYGNDYHEVNGGKFNFRNLLSYIQGTRGLAVCEKLVKDIDAVLKHSLRAIQPLMAHEKHCFEVYGYDIIIDSCLCPWLIEVNASPSLSGTTSSDRIMKHSLVNDVLNIIIPKDFPNAKVGEAGKPTMAQKGDFTVLIDDST